jgi:hypothetical protein
MSDDRVFEIRYEFALDDGTQSTFELRLDPRTLERVDPELEDASAPEWTRLAHQKCDVCPLREGDSPRCPAAMRLVPLVSSFSEALSHDRALVRVRLPEREVVKETTVKEGLGSLIGAYMATSGCPILARLRPMVRFHLPFATRLETLFRMAAAYLFQQYFAAQDGARADWGLEGLAETYALVARMNRAFAKRLRVAVTKDAHVNALVQLDLFAKAFPESIEEQLDELRFLFGERAREPAPPMSPLSLVPLSPRAVNE